VAELKLPVPVCTAAAVGAPPVKVKATVCGLPPPPPVVEVLLLLPPQPANTASNDTQTGKQTQDRRMIFLHKFRFGD
jgi:hypothetical protein